VTDRSNLEQLIAPVSGGCQITVIVAPRASVNRLEMDGNRALRVRVAAPPVDGAANEALIKFLAKALRLPRFDFEIISGATSRHKRVLIKEVAPDDLALRLRGALSRTS
jgi:uncharacterized protein (TIGR00251 family)